MKKNERKTSDSYQYDVLHIYKKPKKRSLVVRGYVEVIETYISICTIAKSDEKKKQLKNNIVFTYF